MWRRSVLPGRVLRSATLGAAAVAITLLLQRPWAEQPAEPAPQAQSADSASAEVPTTAQAGWTFRSAGWYIRVDGVEVPPPVPPPPKPVLVQHPVTPSISAFDQVIAIESRAEGFDWRLITALIFEESRFDPTSRSDKGAYGLMQVRPIAAADVGAASFEAPEDNIRTGVRYLRRLDGMFYGAQGRERLSLVLAAYNLGPGHVHDAQLLARQLGYDPDRWSNSMEMVLPLLEWPTIYQRLPNGYAQGRQGVAYVRRILDRYERYLARTAGADAPGARSPSARQSVHG